jgi:ATP-dependent DNA ligase
VAFPVRPMLGRAVPHLPEGDGWAFEPKWDGFRTLALTGGGEVDLRARTGTASARYFPEIVAGLAPLAGRRLLLDGEILAVRDGVPDFSALLLRVHPAATRVARLARETPATYVVFDLLADGDEDLRPRPFRERRAALERLLAGVEPPVELTQSTADRAAASAWLDARWPGIDGVMAKRPDQPYEQGRRGWLKVKRTHSVDCVVGGFRLFADGHAVSSLLLGLYGDGVLHHVGIVTTFPAAEREALAARLAPHVTDIAGHPWERGFGLEGGPLGRLKGAPGRWTPDLPRDWFPLRPELVAEVVYDKLEGHRFRHPGRLVRWRPDRDPSSCTLDQLPGISPPPPTSDDAR